MRSRRVTAGPSRTLGAFSCSVSMSMPAAFRMWLDSLAPFSGSRMKKVAMATGTPMMARARLQRQLWVAAAM